MKNEITIGELAKLMDVSVHQIRYFEEKEILFPSYIDENGYRMYGLEKIYALSHILVLRKLNISVADIKKLFSTYSTDNIINLLEKSVTDIEKQIEDLQNLKNTTTNIIKKAKSAQKYDNYFTIKDLPERKLSFLGKLDFDSANNARDWYDKFYKAKKVDSIYCSKFITLIGRKNLHLFIETSDSEDYILKTGKYLSYQFLIDDESDFDVRIDDFFAHAKKNKIKLCGYLIEMDDNDISMLYSDKLHVELQMLIK